MAMAVAARALHLELEAARLRQRLVDRNCLAIELDDRAAKLELALHDVDTRFCIKLDDNVRVHHLASPGCLLL